METQHRFLFSDSRYLGNIGDEGVDLVVTSPPYPMIEMWDHTFGCLNYDIKVALERKDGDTAFALMHRELDKTWDEVCRVLKSGGLACINIGDATRKIDDNFQLYSNHAYIVNRFASKGFVCLPLIIWRKQTNSPNKFMGSGMLPPGAYVTLENEFILVFRKGRKREFKTAPEKQNRRESAYFWEERNTWFSDVWDGLKGVNQFLTDGETRNRSGAYPFELPYRLINMFSVKGDTVLDPFLGTGTTTLAAMSSERNSVGVEIDHKFKNRITRILTSSFVQFANDYIQNRLNRHSSFVKARINEGKKIAHYNEHHNCPVISKQEQHLKINAIKNIQKDSDNHYTVTYNDSLYKINSMEPEYQQKQPAIKDIK